MNDLSHVPALVDFATGICGSQLLPEAMNSIPNLVVQMQYGHELGIPPMKALNGIFVIKGKPSLSANLMMTLIESSGLGYVEILEESSNEVKIKGVRYGIKDAKGEIRPDRSYTTSFTMEDAKNAQLTSNSNWKKYPTDMLFSKALGRCARRMFSDVINGMYAQGEIDEKGSPDFREGPTAADFQDVTTPKEKAKNPPKKADTKAATKAKAEPAKEVIVDAEVVQPDLSGSEPEIIQKDYSGTGFVPPTGPTEVPPPKDADTLLGRFRSELVGIKTMEEMAPIFEAFQTREGVMLREQPELAALVGLHRTFLANPNMDSEMLDGELYGRDLIAKF